MLNCSLSSKKLTAECSLYAEYLRQPGEAPAKAEQLVSRFLFRCRQMSAWRHSGNPFSTLFMSIPFVYVQACCKYSAN